MEEKKIAEKIRNLRSEKNITLDYLGQKTGFTKGYLSKLENAGLAYPTLGIENMNIRQTMSLFFRFHLQGWKKSLKA